MSLKVPVVNLDGFEDQELAGAETIKEEFVHSMIEIRRTRRHVRPSAYDPLEQSSDLMFL